MKHCNVVFFVSDCFAIFCECKKVIFFSLCKDTFDWLMASQHPITQRNTNSFCSVEKYFLSLYMLNVEGQLKEQEYFTGYPHKISSMDRWVDRSIIQSISQLINIYCCLRQCMPTKAMASGGGSIRSSMSEPKKRSATYRIDSEDLSSLGSFRQEDRPNNWVSCRMTHLQHNSLSLLKFKKAVHSYQQHYTEIKVIVYYMM